MHLLVIGINYAPEMTSVAPFTTGLCEHLVQRGHQVSVITTFPYYPQWRIQDTYRGSLYRRETIKGVDVRRVIHFIPSSPRNLFQRLLHDITFSLNAMFTIPMVRSFDGILCCSPPPFVPLVVWLASRLFDVPFVINLTDLAVDAATSLGIMKDHGMLVLWAHMLEKFNYKRAAGISVLCRGFKENLVRHGVQSEKVSVVPTWADIKNIRPLSRKNHFRQQYDLAENDFVALYTGNLGLKQGLHTVVEAARLGEEKESDTKWILVGDGEERQSLQNTANLYRLSSLHFLPLQSSEIFPNVLASSDVLLLTQRDTVINTVIPSKLLTYMAAGRPIVASVHHESESARRIREAKCGVIVPSEDPASLLNAVQDLRNSPKEAKRLGANGRNYVENNFSKKAVLKQYVRFLNKSINLQ